MRTIISTITAGLFTLAVAPAVGQGPALTLQAPCAPEAFAAAHLKAEGFVPVAMGSDADGDPFAIYRRGDGAWRAIAIVDVPGSGRLACALLGGDQLSLGLGKEV
ncbi:MAG: hypothetical protein AB7O45_15875 [Alphaproteobacteria bacterium]